MNMHNPPHPGEFIKKTYLEPSGFSIRAVAKELDVSSTTLSRLIKGDSAVSPEMACRLSEVLGRSPESWLQLQAQFDLWHAKKHINFHRLHRLKFI
jgi:addiction module HigA family antidote